VPATYKELVTKTGANIFILDREGPPPGCSDAHRLCVIMGEISQVAQAKEEMEILLSSLLHSLAQVTAHLPPDVGEDPKLMAEAEGLIRKLGADRACAFPGLGLQMGRKIAQLLTTAGHIRKDLIVPKTMVGRILGSGGSKFKEIMSKTSCKVFVLDKEGPPPGYEPDQRMVTLIGFDSQVDAAEEEIESLIQSALNRPQFVRLGKSAASSYPEPYFDLSNRHEPYCDLSAGRSRDRDDDRDSHHGPRERGYKRERDRERD